MAARSILACANVELSGGLTPTEKRFLFSPQVPRQGEPPALERDHVLQDLRVRHLVRGLALQL